MTFRLTIKTGNAAFGERDTDTRDFDRRREIVRILRAVADRMESRDESFGSIQDINGNTVGNFNTRGG